MGGGCHDFPSKLFSITVPKNFVAEPFCVSENIWKGENLKVNRLGEVSQFSVGSYLSHSAENFRKEPFEVSEKLKYCKILCIMGCYHDFPSKVFNFHSTAKLRSGTLLCFREFLVRKQI